MKIVNGIRVFTLELTEQALHEISAALMNHPFGKAAPVVNEINSQINAQQVNIPDAPPSPHAPAYQASE